MVEERKGKILGFFYVLTRGHTCLMLERWRERGVHGRVEIESWLLTSEVSFEEAWQLGTLFGGRGAGCEEVDSCEREMGESMMDLIERQELVSLEISILFILIQLYFTHLPSIDNITHHSNIANLHHEVAPAFPSPSHFQCC